MGERCCAGRPRGRHGISAIEAADRASDHEPTIHWKVSRTSAACRVGSRKHLSPSAMRSEPVGRIGGFAVISRRRQSHAPSSLKGRFSGDEFHAKMKSPPENLVSPLFYGTEKFFDFFQPTVESDFGNPKFTPAFASKDGFDKGSVAW